jgi:hypothetical protein
MPGCSQGYSPVTFTYSNGEPVDDLTACTNSDQSQTIITNTSQDTVWYVALPSYSYWSASQDVQDSDLSATAVLFRFGIRTLGDTDPTIEPGVSVPLDAALSIIELKQDPGEQTAWQEASLLVESAVDKSRDAIISILEDSSSPLGSAVIACVSAGYEIGQGLSNQDPSAEEIQSQLSGINNSTQECGSKIDEAQEELDKRDEAPELTLRSVADKTHEDPEWEEAGRVISDDLQQFEHEILKLHE